jgi:DNA-binding XRE family transcriptional regulator
MKQDWLWDRKINSGEARRILNNPEDPKFVLMASLLLARKAEPKEVFKSYLGPLLFCENWQAIKKRMRQDKWNTGRIIFWQAIYEKLLEKYRGQGVSFMRRKNVTTRDVLCDDIGNKIHKARKETGLSQKGLAQKASMSQQLISRIEKGRENISVITIGKIAKALGREINIDISCLT